MMQHYFGLSTVEVAARRRMTGINIRQGRCAALSDDENAALWRQWQKPTSMTPPVRMGWTS